MAMQKLEMTKKPNYNYPLAKEHIHLEKCKIYKITNVDNHI